MCEITITIESGYHWKWCQNKISTGLSKMGPKQDNYEIELDDNENATGKLKISLHYRVFHSFLCY